MAWTDKVMSKIQKTIKNAKNTILETNRTEGHCLLMRKMMTTPMVLMMLLAVQINRDLSIAKKGKRMVRV